VSRALALIPDLLFGSNVIGALRAAGVQAELIGSDEEILGRLAGVELLVVDLTGDIDAAAVVASLPCGVRTLAFYSHVDVEAKRRAEAAGFDLAVSRSRMAREGAELVKRLLAAGPA
jgi:hypothetical protein